MSRVLCKIIFVILNRHFWCLENCQQRSAVDLALKETCHWNSQVKLNLSRLYYDCSALNRYKLKYETCFMGQHENIVNFLLKTDPSTIISPTGYTSLLSKLINSLSLILKFL